MGYYVDGLEILSEPCKRTMLQMIKGEEKILYCVSSRRKRPNLLERDKLYQSLNGYHNWLDGLVFLDDRLIFFQGPKYGFVISGDINQQTLRFNSIAYQDIQSIAIDTPPGASIYFIVNSMSMIMPSASEPELRVLEAWLRATVQQKRQQVAPIPQPAASDPRNLVAELEKLAELHRSGSLTDDEFAALKKKLLEA